MSDTKRTTVSSIAVAILVIASFFFWYVSRYDTHAISATKDCLDIFKEKNTEYFGENGVSRFIFSKKMNTCLILNVYANEGTGEYRVITADMISDGVLFAYTLGKDETKDSVYGLTKEEALERARNYGFIFF